MGHVVLIDNIECGDKHKNPIKYNVIFEGISKQYSSKIDHMIHFDKKVFTGQNYVMAFRLDNWNKTNSELNIVIVFSV